ncbi:MAG: BlaI/MecI/CopY family transcriptional regulator [Prevotellaceae bacterium]|jgi:predicted transcriptional regulator|nr:BlaI/MecI/CopY family transcriptional regulator [Prevotellaceae bacterium]
MKKMLTKAEEQVMQVLWQTGRSGLGNITDAMPSPKPHPNTIATVLKILAEKGFVKIEAVSRVNIYAPVISKKKYSDRSMKNIVNNYFNGSFSNAVSFLVENKNLSIADLELLIETLKNRNK